MSQEGKQWVMDVTEADFDAQVIERSRMVPVVVDFWAPWCGPCRALGPLIERCVQERQGEVLLAKVNVDQCPNLALTFGVQSIPLVVAFRGGQPVDHFIGGLPEAEVREFLDRLKPSEAEQLFKAAQAEESKNPRQAEALYRQVLEKEPQFDAAVLGLARLLVEAQRDQEAEAFLERLGPGGVFKDEADRLRAILFLRRKSAPGKSVEDLSRELSGDPENPRKLYELGCRLAGIGRHEAALANLLKAAERDKALARDQVKEAMVQIFHLIGVRSPLADEYRGKLARLLY
jgi:putative thioredoxin